MPFLSRMRSKSKLKPTAHAEEAAPAAEGGTANAPAGALSPGGADSESGGDSSPARPSSPPPIPVEFAQVRAPMAKKLSFARRRSREEEAELNAATPDDNSQEDELLSPASAQLLREALQAEADAGIASSLVCPITNELMTDPVFTTDGQVSPTHTHTYTLTLTHAQTLPLTLTLSSTLPLTLTRRTSARLSRRGCATTTPRPPPASRCPPRCSLPTCAREACCASCPS